MKISVLIPVKNRADLLPATLDNLLAQSLPPYEIIVADDGSTDHLPQVIEQYKDRVIFTKNEGSGPGAGRNTGLKIATGNLIQFFDSDDLMTKNKLEVQAKALADTDKGMVYGPYVMAEETAPGQWIQRDVVMQCKPVPATLPFHEWVMRGWCSITQACLFDKKFITEEVGYWRTDLMTHEDYELMYRIGKACRYPEHVSAGGVVYRQHGTQITDLSTKQISRALNGINAMRFIKEQQVSNTSFFTKAFFEARRWLAVNNIAGQGANLQEHLTHLNTKNRIFALLYRAYGKWQSKKTGNSWQEMHGTCNDSQSYQKIIDQLPS